MDDRTQYWQWDNLPPKLVKQWDCEQRKMRLVADAAT
jgi:hypothetical protein